MRKTSGIFQKKKSTNCTTLLNLTVNIRKWRNFLDTTVTIGEKWNPEYKVNTKNRQIETCISTSIFTIQ